MPVSLIEIAAVAASILGVWLTIRRSMWCWLFSLMSVLLYSWIFYAAKLYSDVLLQGIYIVLTLYGWRRWLRSSREPGALSVAPLAWNIGLRDMLCGLGVAALLGSLMHRYTDASLPWLDSILTGLSLVGQLWMARRQIACWWLWIAVDAAYSVVFCFKGLYLTSLLYAIFVALAGVGLRSWRMALAASAEQAIHRLQERGAVLGEQLRVSGAPIAPAENIRAHGG